MNILACHNRYRQRSGEDVVFDSMIRILESRGHRVILVTVSNESLDRLPSAVASLMATPFSLRSYRAVRSVVRRERPDVAIVQNVFPILSPAVYWALRHEGVPVIQKLFNYRLGCLSGNFFSRGKVCERCIRGNYFHGIVRRCFRASFALSGIYAAALALHRWLGTFHRCIDRYVVPDRFLGSKLQEAGYNASRFRRVANPFDPTEFVSETGQDGYLLFVGRLVREKGILTLLEAARRSPGVRVRVVGDGPLRQRVERKRPANVEFLGPQYGETLKATMARALAVVVPSEWYDNGPMVVYQAFAMGKPVIASEIDGLPELVVPGKTGWLCRPSDAESLAAALADAAGNPARAGELGRGAREWAERHFGADRYYDGLLGVMKEVARPRPESQPLTFAAKS